MLLWKCGVKRICVPQFNSFYLLQRSNYRIIFCSMRLVLFCGLSTHQWLPFVCCHLWSQVTKWPLGVATEQEKRPSAFKINMKLSKQRNIFFLKKIQKHWVIFFFIKTLKLSAHPVPVTCLKISWKRALPHPGVFRPMNAAQTRLTRGHLQLSEVDVITPTGNMEQSDTPEPAGLAKLQLQTGGCCEKITRA